MIKIAANWICIYFISTNVNCGRVDAILLVENFANKEKNAESIPNATTINNTNNMFDFQAVAISQPIPARVARVATQVDNVLGFVATVG